MTEGSTGRALEARGISKSFGGISALDGVDFDLIQGEVHALLGENGAGKTTLSNVLAGLYRADAGQVLIDGSPHEFRTPSQAIAAGIGMVHQHFRLVEPMTVAENLHLGWEDTPKVCTRRALAARAKRFMDEIGLHVDPTAYIWQLSVGEQQRVEILRVLARGARILILDEPTAVLTAQETTELFEVLRRLVNGGRSVVFISHKLKEVLDVSDRITVLRRGVKEITRPTEGATIPELALLMTGESDEIDVTHRKVDGKVALEISKVTARNDRDLIALREVDLSVREGEILGIAGVSGNGQTELAEVLAGMRVTDHGSVHVAGQDLTNAPARVVIDHGVGHIPEDRIGMGLVLPASVEDNAVLRHYRREDFSTGIGLDRGAVTAFAERLVNVGRVQTRSLHATVGELSGGNQQRLIAHREAAVADRVMIASQPTRGLDVLAAQEVQSTLLDLRDGGCAVLLISDDLDEILLMSDRVAVMYEGKIVGVFDSADADRDKIGILMGGHQDADSLR